MTQNFKDQLISKGQEVEVYEEVNNYLGWVPAIVKEVKGDFYLLEFNFSEKSQTTQTKIITRNNIRPRTERGVIELNAQDNVIIYSLPFIQNLNNKEKKLSSLKKQIESLVQPFFIFCENDETHPPQIYVFLENYYDEEKVQLLEAIMDTVREHYVELESIKIEVLESQKFSKEEKTSKQQSTHRKSKTSKSEDPKEFSHISSINLERFIYDMLKPKIDQHKKSSNVKIELKNTKDPNVLKLEIKSNDEKIFKSVCEDLNIVQKYLNLKINEKDRFLIEEKGPMSLKYYIDLFKLTSFRIFKLDEETISLQLIGQESAVAMVSNLIEEYVKSINIVEEKRKELEKIKI
jgi:hypothetical protein